MSFRYTPTQSQNQLAGRTSSRARSIVSGVSLSEAIDSGMNPDCFVADLLAKAFNRRCSVVRLIPSKRAVWE
jgi:hypothetical protein